MSLSLADAHASLPTAWRLYLPKDWAMDAERRAKAGVPEEIAFKTKPEIALDQIRTALAAGLARGVVLMGAGYGLNSDFRSALSELGLRYVAGIVSTTSVWAAGGGLLTLKPSTPSEAINQTPALRCRSSTGLGQGFGAEPAGCGLEVDRPVRGNERQADVALRARARAHAGRISRRLEV